MKIWITLKSFSHVFWGQNTRKGQRGKSIVERAARNSLMTPIKTEEQATSKSLQKCLSWMTNRADRETPVEGDEKPHQEEPALITSSAGENPKKELISLAQEIQLHMDTF